jgi:hypothetical protein
MHCTKRNSLPKKCDRRIKLPVGTSIGTTWPASLWAYPIAATRRPIVEDLMPRSNSHARKAATDSAMAGSALTLRLPHQPQRSRNRFYRPSWWLGPSPAVRDLGMQSFRRGEQFYTDANEDRPHISCGTKLRIVARCGLSPNVGATAHPLYLSIYGESRNFRLRCMSYQVAFIRPVVTRGCIKAAPSKLGLRPHSTSRPSRRNQAQLV